MIITIDYLGVLMAAVASFAFGALWHSQLGFGMTWRSLMGLSEKDMRSTPSAADRQRARPLSPVQAMLLGFIATLLFAYVLAHFIVLAGVAAGGVSVGVALEAGFWVWLGFAVVILANGYLWEGKPLNLFLFNAAYQFLSIELMAGVIGVMH